MPVGEFEAVLDTVLANEDGELRRTQRKTKVRLYEPLAGESAMLYDVGIPVVETGDRCHADVQQKVPLNMERDKITPAHRRELRVEVLNAMSGRLEAEEAPKPWVQDALADGRVTGDAVHAVPLAFADEKALEPLPLEGLPSLIVIDRLGRTRLLHTGYDGSERLDAELSREIDTLLKQ